MEQDYVIVGEFDASKYNLKFNVTTKDVILTRNRLYHIIEKHPEVGKHIRKIKNILSDPDEIYVEVNQIDTIWIIKEMKNNIKITLKLNTIERGSDGYKHSIIQMQFLDKQRIINYLNSNRISKVFAKEKVM